MSERNYYVICDDNCKFEGMTKEQIIAAIAEATGETPTHIDDAFITKIKEQNKNARLKFWIGTSAEFNATEEKESDCLYIITNESTFEEQVEELDERLTVIENKPQPNTVLWTGVISITSGMTKVSGIDNYKLICVAFSKSSSEDATLRMALCYENNNGVFEGNWYSASNGYKGAISITKLSNEYINYTAGTIQIGAELFSTPFIHKIIGIL